MNIHQKVAKRLIYSLITTTLWCSLTLSIPVYAYTQEEASQLVTQAYCTIFDGGESEFSIDAFTSYSDVIRASEKSISGGFLSSSRSHAPAWECVWHRSGGVVS